jgi:hypothetical protein
MISLTDQLREEYASLGVEFHPVGMDFQIEP